MPDKMGFDYLVEWLPSMFYGVLILFFMAFIVIAIGFPIYNVYFHPLSKFPGPISAAATPIPFVYRLLNGRLADWVQSLHEQYGGIVRIQPGELSFVEPSAWQEIFASRPALPKPKLGTIANVNRVPSLNTAASTEDHSRMRKILSHGFSDRALKEQEYILHTYTNLLIRRLQELVNAAEQGSAEVDMCAWYGFTTFDTIGDLLFGDSFHSLENSEHHPWVKSIYPGVKFGTIMTAFDHFGPMGSLARWCLPKSLARKKYQHFQWASERIDQRMQQKTDRPDFMTYILRNNDEKGMTRAEIDSNAALLILAGSDTSALTCASSTWFALKNRLVMETLQKEIRSSFDSTDDITIASTASLPYLHAVIQEALRLHPPGPLSVPREVDRPDVVVCGHLIPVGTRVGIPSEPAHRLSKNFVEPLSFLPERWLENADPKFDADRKDVYEPFMVGPRGCMGKSLAWAEMKLILAKVIWSFDLAVSENQKKDWADQKIWILHERGPLFVNLRSRFEAKAEVKRE